MRLSVTSRVDYSKSLYYGLPDYQLHKLQRVLNSSARLVLSAPRFCHITPLLRELHWLPIRSRVELKLLLITFKLLKGLAPLYLSELISVLPPSTYYLRRNYNGTLLCTPNSNLREPWGIAHFPQPRPPYEIRYHSQLGMLTSLPSHLRRKLRPIYLPEFLLSNSCNSFVHICIYICLFQEFYFYIYIYSYISYIYVYIYSYIYYFYRTIVISVVLLLLVCK